MAGPPSLLPPELPATDEVERDEVSQETAGLGGPAHLADLPPHHQVSTALVPGPAWLGTVVHTATTPGEPRVYNHQETLRAIFRTR